MSRLSSTTLRIGDPAPPFSLTTLEGNRFHLGDAVRGGIALLVFVPGSWSPSARRQMTELATLYPAFEEAGINVVMIVTQDAGSLRRRLEATPPPFPVLADVERTAARDYGVFRAVSWDGIGVTRPASFVIDREGAIRFLYVGERDNDAPDASSLLRIATWLRDEMPRPEEAEADTHTVNGLEATAVIDALTSEAGTEAPATEQLGGEALVALAEAATAADDAVAGEPPTDDVSGGGPEQADERPEAGSEAASTEPGGADEQEMAVNEADGRAADEAPEGDGSDRVAASDGADPAPDSSAPLNGEERVPTHPANDAPPRPTATGTPADH